MLKLQQICRAQIELTTRCNARCPMCMRNYRGLDYNSGYPDCELTLPQIKQIFEPNFLSHLQQVNFNGNLGDFALARDALEIVEFFVDHGVAVDINSNGSLRTPEWWARLALPGVTVGFALDGLADTHSLYRQDTDWHRVISNAKALIAAGGRAVWRFIPFDHNRHQETICRDLATSMGFVRFENIYDGRDSGPVYTRDGKFSHWLGAAQPSVPPIKDLLHSHVTWFRADTVNIPKDTANVRYNCQHQRAQEIYIAANGTVYPCCYLGFYPDQMAHPGNAQLAPLVHENNALIHGLEHSLAWFDSVEATWAKSSIGDGRLYHCVNSCGAPA